MSALWASSEREWPFDVCVSHAVTAAGGSGNQIRLHHQGPGPRIRGRVTLSRTDPPPHTAWWTQACDCPQFCVLSFHLHRLPASKLLKDGHKLCCSKPIKEKVVKNVHTYGVYISEYLKIWTKHCLVIITSIWCSNFCGNVNGHWPSITCQYWHVPWRSSDQCAIRVTTDQRSARPRWRLLPQHIVTVIYGQTRAFQ